jgi:hypothetical protein
MALSARTAGSLRILSPWYDATANIVTPAKHSFTTAQTKRCCNGYDRGPHLRLHLERIEDGAPTRQDTGPPPNTLEMPRRASVARHRSENEHDE